MSGLRCFNCKAPTVRFVPKGGGAGIKCTECSCMIYHPDFTWEQIERVWAYRCETKEEQQDE